VENKKVKNAHECIVDGIKFKSDLEGTVYSMLKWEGYNPEYEKNTFYVWRGKKFLTPCYDPHKDRKLGKVVWGINTYKPQDIKYKPDFVFTVDDMLIVVEVKGYSNDRYPYQKKLFFRWLEDNNPNSAFFEIHNKKQLKEAIDIIKKFSEQ
jgi:hypothetical protein